MFLQVAILIITKVHQNVVKDIEITKINMKHKNKLNNAIQ